MSLRLAQILAAAPKKKRSRDETLALLPKTDYSDGRTKQCHKDECDINKIMARFDKTGTISHVSKFEGVYADFSDYDFFGNAAKLNAGADIFSQLPGELRKEFKQSPEAFFKYVNDPANAVKENYGLPGLAAPGQQLPRPNNNDADSQAAQLNADVVSKPVAPSSETKADPPPASK